MAEISLGKPTLLLLLFRIMAVVYDGLLSFGLLVIGSAPFSLSYYFYYGHAMLPLSLPQILLSIYAYILLMCFFAWFWSRGGQTLGMRAWRLRVLSNQTTENQVVYLTFRQAAWRFFLCSITPIIHWLPCLWRQDRRGLQDLFAHSQVLRENKAD